MNEFDRAMHLAAQIKMLESWTSTARAELAKQLMGAKPATPFTPGMISEQVRTFLRSNRGRPISINELARSIGVDRDQKGRACVRSALQHLTIHKKIARLPQRGFYIALNM